MFYKVCLSLLFASFTAVIFIVTKSTQKPPNLVIISIDTLRPDHMGVYGYPKNTTPNIDKWAKDALVFTNARVTVPMTIPSFIELMTGLDSFETRVFNNKQNALSNNVKTLGESLVSDGYKTAFFLSGALSSSRINFGDRLDNTYYLGFKSYVVKDGQEEYFQTDREEYEDYIGRALAWIKDHKTQKFFVWIHLMDPHAPYEPTDGLECKFGPQYCDYLNSKSPAEIEQERVRYQFCQNTAVPSATVGMFEALYDASVFSSDIQAGRILSLIESENLDRNTLVILYGDHGEGFDHNYFFNHRGVLYESAIKTPLIIKDPGSRKKGTADALIKGIDIHATILDLLNIKAKGNYKYDRKTAFFTNSDLSKFAILEGPYKYIYSLPQSCLFEYKTEELYDIYKDPLELQDLSSLEAGIKGKLKERLFLYLSQYNLPPLRPVPVESIGGQTIQDKLRDLPY